MNGLRLSVNEYVAELGRKLGIGPDMADILDEVRDHLLEGVSAYREDGLDEEAAAAEAVRDFGEPDFVATGLRLVVAQRHSRELAWRLLRGWAALVCCGLLGFLLLSLWLGAIPDHTRADEVGITAGVTAARLLGGATLVMFWVAYRRRFWSSPRLARRLLLLCVGAEWLLTLAWLVCPAIVGAPGRHLHSAHPPAVECRGGRPGWRGRLQAHQASGRHQAPPGRPGVGRFVGYAEERLCPGYVDVLHFRTCQTVLPAVAVEL